MVLRHFEDVVDDLIKVTEKWRCDFCANTVEIDWDQNTKSDWLELECWLNHVWHICPDCLKTKNTGYIHTCPHPGCIGHSMFSTIDEN